MNRSKLTSSLVYAVILVTALGSFDGIVIARHLTSVRHKKSSRIKRPTPKRNLQDKRPTPEEIWKGIKAAAQNEVRSKSPLIMVPFSVEKLGSTRHFTIVKDVVRELEFKDDPYDRPFREQLLIEALRLSLAESNQGVVNALAVKEVASDTAPNMTKTESNWEQYLVSAEGFVKKSIVDIETDPDKKSLDKKLRENENQIEDIIYGKIYEEVGKLAQGNGYDIIFGRGSGEIKKFSINITTVPDGAKVLIMTDLVYRKQLLTNTNPAQWPWIEIVQNPYQLLGRYRYRTVWPDGKRAEGSIDVANGSPLRFVPN